MSFFLNTTSRLAKCALFVSHRRTFFASSTDHTSLLENAQVHRIDNHGKEGQQLYVMAADGMNLEMVKKVPQLHLARLFRHGKTIYGAKVVNSTLGTPKHVCSRLVDAALEEGISEAKSTLHGLSDWVQNVLIDKSEDIDAFTSLTKEELEAIHQILKHSSSIDDKIYDAGKEKWEQLAK